MIVVELRLTPRRVCPVVRPHRARATTKKEARNRGVRKRCIAEAPSSLSKVKNAMVNASAETPFSRASGRLAPDVTP